MDSPALALGIAAVTVAPVVGLVGVLAGARMSARNDHRRWLREQRLMLTTEALTAAAGLNVALNVYVRLALETDEHDGAVYARAQNLWDSWLLTYDRTRLVLPSDVQELRQLHLALEGFMELSEESIDAKTTPDADAWDGAAMAVNLAMTAFLDFARKLIHDE